MPWHFTVTGLALNKPRPTRVVCTVVILLNLYAFVVNLNLFFAVR